jgi:hypothetical protein
MISVKYFEGSASYTVTPKSYIFEIFTNGRVVLWLTPNMIFGMGNIWVILRNVIKTNNIFCSKKPHLSQLFRCQSFRIRGHLVNFWYKKQRTTNCNSPDDIVSGNFDSEKVDQDEVFYHKDILHFFFEWPKYYSIQKIIFGVSHTLSENAPRCSLL